MKTIDLDAARWKTPLDLHDAICEALGAPHWHGRGIDALLDSTIWHDDINAVKPPYALKIHGLADAPQDVRDEVQMLGNALAEARAEHRRMHGVDVPVELELVD